MTDVVEPVLHGTCTIIGDSVVLRGEWAMNETEFAAGQTESWETTFQPEAHNTNVLFTGGEGVPPDGAYQGRFLMRQGIPNGGGGEDDPPPPEAFAERMMLRFTPDEHAPGYFQVSGTGKNAFGSFWLEGALRMHPAPVRQQQQQRQRQQGQG